MLAQVDQVLRSAGTDEPPAHMLIIGARGSSGAVPPQGKRLAFPIKQEVSITGAFLSGSRDVAEDLILIPSFITCLLSSNNCESQHESCNHLLSLVLLQQALNSSRVPSQCVVWGS